MKTNYVYILTNYTNTTLYIGVTSNIYRRLSEHNDKAVDSFTKKYNLNKLVYVEEYSRCYCKRKATEGLAQGKKECLNKFDESRMERFDQRK